MGKYILKLGPAELTFKTKSFKASNSPRPFSNLKIYFHPNFFNGDPKIQTQKKQTNTNIVENSNRFLLSNYIDLAIILNDENNI